MDSGGGGGVVDGRRRMRKKRPSWRQLLFSSSENSGTSSTKQRNYSGGGGDGDGKYATLAELAIRYLHRRMQQQISFRQCPSKNGDDDSGGVGDDELTQTSGGIKLLNRSVDCVVAGVRGSVMHQQGSTDSAGELLPHNSIRRIQKLRKRQQRRKRRKSLQDTTGSSISRADAFSSDSDSSDEEQRMLLSMVVSGDDILRNAERERQKALERFARQPLITPDT